MRTEQGKWRFLHRSLQEYFVSASSVKKVIIKKRTRQEKRKKSNNRGIIYTKTYLILTYLNQSIPQGMEGWRK